MGAFDRIKSGLPGMNRLLDSIRMGDNVVWSVSNLEEFTFFALPFAEQAVRDSRNIIYMRFAKHEPLLLPGRRGAIRGYHAVSSRIIRPLDRIVRPVSGRPLHLPSVMI